MKQILSLIAILAASLPLLAEEATSYKIDIRSFPAEGKSVKVTETAKINQSVKVLDENGKALKNDKTVKVVTLAFTEKIIEGGDKKPKKYSRSFSKAEDVTGDKTEKLGYSGRTVLYTLEKDKYTAKVEGKPDLEDKDVDELEKEANKDNDGSVREAVLPKKAVKVGETWKLEAKDVAKVLKELGAEKDKAKGTGKLVKAYKKDGKQYGVMQFDLEATTKGDAAGKAEVTMTVDAPIDGSSATGKVRSKVKFDGEQNIEQNGMKFKVEIRVQVEGTAEREDVVEKK